jgi:hypothetical protein
VGSNNINLLKPSGPGVVCGGKDCASARYIHTELANVTLKIFRPEDAPVSNTMKMTVPRSNCMSPLFLWLWQMDYLGLPQVSPHASHASILSTSLDNARRFALSEDIQPMSPKYRGFKGRLLKFSMIKELLRSGNHPGTLRRTSEKTTSKFRSEHGQKITKPSSRPKYQKAKFSRGRLTLHRGRRTIRSPLRYSTRCRSSYDIRRFETYDRAEKSEDDSIYSMLLRL